MKSTLSYILQMLVVLVIGFIGWSEVAKAQGLVTQIVDPKPTAHDSSSSVSSENVSSFLSNHKDWVVSCQTLPGNSQLENCEISTLPSSSEKPSKNTNALEMRLVGIIKGKAAQPVFFIQTPLGLLLSKGAALKVDKRNIGLLTFRSCHLTGCLIPFRLTNKIRNSFMRGQVAHLTVYDLSAKPLTVKFSLQGFTAALQTANDQVDQS